MAVNDFAVIGLNTIGRGLTSIMKDRQYNVAVYDSEYDKAFNFSGELNTKVKAYRDFKSLSISLSVPRKIFLCVDNEFADEVLEQLLPHLTKADTIIDMSDSYYLNVMDRAEKLKLKSVRYLDVSATGTEKDFSSSMGIIAGGPEEAFSGCSRILRQISKEYKGFSSCIHSGDWGTGKYTKLVHDVIELSLMQVISDAYFMLRTLGKMKCSEIAAAFSFINDELNSYLLGITAEIIEQVDEGTDTPIIDFIMDSANVSTGALKAVNESQIAKVPLMMSSQAVALRYLSQQREPRRYSTSRLYAPAIRYDAGNIKLLDTVKDAMKACMIIAYAQGFELLRAALKTGEWAFGEDEIARVWAGSSTISANYLDRAHIAFNKNEQLYNMMHDDYFSNQLKSLQRGFRETVMLSAKHSVPVPSFMSALSYYDSMRSEKLPANLIQSQLNYMKRDTVKRYDVQGNFNVDWVLDENKKKDPS